MPLDQGRYNTIYIGLDCIGFQLTGLYILGYIKDNIHCVGTNVGGVISSQEAIDLNLYEIDDNYIPFLVRTEEKKFYIFTHEGVKYWYAYDDFNDITPEDKRTVEFFVEVRENDKFIGLNPATIENLPEEVRNKALYKLIPSEEYIQKCVPNDGEHYYSAGVGNTLANVFGLFKFYYTAQVAEQDRVGMIGVMRQLDNRILAMDHTGTIKTYRTDYVSHVYTVLPGDRVADSSIDAGLYIWEPNKYKDLTKYYLQIQLK
ncbi:MAG: hypothetical protein EPN93_00990 [Spirochaetes bacterium]|nr:MAG: hypothetical protein EPN93_00990 [Spirochaetota bacterium]